MLNITDLPEDILLEIARCLSVQDVLALKQTCRVLHAFGSTEYLWHLLVKHFDLPIGTPSDSPPDELQRQTIKAIKLERNWRRDLPVIKGSEMILGPNREPFAHMELLREGKWLLTAQRYHRLLMTRITTRMSVWSLANVSHPSRLFHVEISGTYRSSTMALRKNDSFATLVVAFNEDEEEILEVHSFPLRVRPGMLASSSGVIQRLSLPSYPVPGRGVIQDVGLADDIIVITLAIFGDEGGVSFHIVLASADKGQPCWVDSKFTQGLNCIRVRLYRGRIFIVGQQGNTTVVRIHKLPQHILSWNSPSLAESDVIDIGPVESNYVYTLPKGMISMTDELHVPRQFHKTIPIVMFDVVGAVIRSTRIQSSGCAISFPYDLRGNAKEGSSTVLPCPDATSQQLAQIGATGYRMVWLEHDLETGRNRVMRYSMQTGSRKHLHGVLLPAKANLPFALNACNALAFDEVSGRLCLAFYDGSLHVLDFV
ncbi:hypothetical protein QCA50_005796 [Cerrena zonata]|uniref:F-box domain-containing protein n=1 Tax=Cerrena zonata TaxID=2478898 RepID=A0AAW0GE16_9APHY